VVTDDIPEDKSVFVFVETLGLIVSMHSDATRPFERSVSNFTCYEIK